MSYLNYIARNSTNKSWPITYFSVVIPNSTQYLRLLGRVFLLGRDGTSTSCKATFVSHVALLSRLKDPRVFLLLMTPALPLLFLRSCHCRWHICFFFFWGSSAPSFTSTAYVVLVWQQTNKGCKNSWLIILNSTFLRRSTHNSNPMVAFLDFRGHRELCHGRGGFDKWDLPNLLAKQVPGRRAETW